MWTPRVTGSTPVTPMTKKRNARPSNATALKKASNYLQGALHHATETLSSPPPLWFSGRVRRGPKQGRGRQGKRVRGGRQTPGRRIRHAAGRQGHRLQRS